MTKLLKLKIGKSELLVAVLWLLLVPWASGGKDPVAVLVDYFAVVAAVLLIARLPRTRGLGSSWLGRLAIGWVGWSALSLIWSVNRYQTIRFVILQVLAMAAFCVAYQCAGELKRFELWVRGYLVLTAIFSVLGFWIYLTGSYNRLTSTFYWANPLAAWLLPAVIMVIWFYVSGRSWFYLAAATMIGAALILTNSRSAMLVLALIGLVVLIRARLQPRAWGRVLLAGICIAGLTAGVNLGRQKSHQSVLSPGSRFVEAAKGESTSSQDRLYYLGSALLIWRDHAWLGTGAGTFGSEHPYYQKLVISASSSAHNFYAQTLAEQGLLGVILLAVLVLTLLVGGWKTVRSDSHWWPVWLGLMALLLHFGLDIDSEYPVLMVLAATLAGWLYRPAGEPTETRPVKYPWVVLAALAAIGLPTISLYQSQLVSTQGSYSQDDGDYARAADYYKKAHAGVAYDPDVLTSEGINYYIQARAGQSAATNLALAGDRAMAAAKLDPRDAQHKLLLARVLRQSGDKTGAEAAYRQAINLDPYNNPNYYSDLVGLEIEQNRLEAALTDVNRVLELHSDEVVVNRAADTELPREIASLYAARASIYLRRQQAALAADDLQRALKLDSLNPLANQLKAQLKNP